MKWPVSNKKMIKPLEMKKSERTGVIESIAFMPPPPINGSLRARAYTHAHMSAYIRQQSEQIVLPLMLILTHLKANSLLR